jgi:hypothetical protein
MAHLRCDSVVIVLHIAYESTAQNPEAFGKSRCYIPLLLQSRRGTVYNQGNHCGFLDNATDADFDLDTWEFGTKRNNNYFRPRIKDFWRTNFSVIE